MSDKVKRTPIEIVKGVECERYLDRSRLFHQITPFLIKTHIRKEEIVWRRKKWIEKAQTVGGQEGRRAAHLFCLYHQY